VRILIGSFDLSSRIFIFSYFCLPNLSFRN
jgi:hypothetical protein